MRRLLVLGAAPRLHDDLRGIDTSAYDVCAVNRAGYMYTGDIKFWCTYHPDNMIQEKWYLQRSRVGGNSDYTIVLHSYHTWIERVCSKNAVEYFAGPSTTGSSALLATLYGLNIGYDAVVLAGAPLIGEYCAFHAGWVENKNLLAGRVVSLSGWTKDFLESIA